MADDEILRRLDLIHGTLQLAFAPQIEAARESIREDPIKAAILDVTESWSGSGDVQKVVAEQTGKTTRSVRDRFPGLMGLRVLEARGSGYNLEYRRTGLV